MKQCVIVGGGYSVKEGIDKGLWDKIRGKEVWACNSIFKIMPYLPTRELWVDKDFWNHEIDNLQQLQLKGVELITKDYFRLAGLQEQITQYGTERELAAWKSEMLQEQRIFTGAMGLVGMFDLGVAVMRGYDEIFLLGYDFGSPGLDIKSTHVVQERILELNILSYGAGRPEVYILPDGQLRNEIKDWEAYTTFPNKIWNVSMISNLTYFPKITYDDFFSKIS